MRVRYAEPMELLGHLVRCLLELAGLCRPLVTDGLRFVALCARLRASVATENLFLRKQLAFYQERQVNPSVAKI